MLDAAQLAAILDPERKVPGWWLKVCPNCGISARIGYGYGGTLPRTACGQCNHFLGLTDPFDKLVASEEDFTGPPDLHTAREHCWRKEDWLEARGCCWLRNWHNRNETSVIDNTGQTISEQHTHAAALNAAIERISNEVR